MAHAASPIYSWEWTTEGTQITAPGWNGSFNYTTGNDYATFGSGSGGGTPYNSGIAGISGSFTVSFDLKNLSSTNNAWKDVFSLYSNGTVSGESNSMVLEFNASGELYFYNKGFGGQSGGNINTGLTWTDLQQDNWNNLSIVSDLSSQTLSVYVNGTLAGTITGWNPSSPALTGSQFGASHERNHRCQQHQILRRRCASCSGSGHCFPGAAGPGRPADAPPPELLSICRYPARGRMPGRVPPHAAFSVFRHFRPGIHVPVNVSPGMVQAPGGTTLPGKTTVLAPRRT